jgi:DNA primase
MESRGLLEAVKSRLDIVDVLSEYVQLKKAGANYKGLCPFHSEKTPSFMVSPDKQMYHCFGCGEGGDTVAFVMKQESMSFPEALRFLARKAGLRPEDYETGDWKKYADEKDAIKAVLKEAGAFYARMLEENRPARDYLEKRGVDAEAVKRFSLGYAPDDWHALGNHLKKKGFIEAQLVQSGVAQRGQKGNVYDFLRGRIIFPIRDLQGEVIAFGGRVMDSAEAGQPKYLNTSETVLFKKGETLYGLDLARDAIRKKEYAVFSEGYLDVIMCHMHGFEHVVAPLGTALTEGHLKRIGRRTNRLVFVFDGDQAGINAAKRALALALENDFRVKVALMPAGEDPDSLIRAKGAQAFKRYLGGSVSPVQFVLKTAKGPRVDVIKEAAGLVARVQEPIMREELIKELSEAGRIREEAVRQEVTRRPGREPLPMTGANGKKGSFMYDEETLLLSVFVNMPEKRAWILENAGLEDIADPVVRGLFEKLGNLDILTEDEKRLLAKVSIEPNFKPSEADESVEGCVRKLHLRKLEKRIREAKDKGEHEALAGLHREREKLKGGSRS